jgi:rare lipoprotein A
MKKLIFYTLIIIFSFTSLLTIFSFTSIDKKKDKQIVKQHTNLIGNTTQAASNEAPPAESEALTIVDNTSATSGIPANLPVGGYRPTKEIAARAIYGVASYYHNMFNGRRTSNGEIFSQQKLTGASNFLPLNEWVRVTNLDNGKL